MSEEVEITDPILPSAQFLSAGNDFSACKLPFEVIGVSLMKKGSLEVSGAVARALLNDDGHLLSRLCISGAREGRFVPVVGWLEIVEENANVLVKCLLKHVDQLPFILNTFSRALLSPSFNVVTAAANVLAAVCSEMAQAGHFRALSVWLARSGALKVLVTSAETVSAAAGPVFSVIHSCAQQQYLHLFTHTLFDAYRDAATTAGSPSVGDSNNNNNKSATQAFLGASSLLVAGLLATQPGAVDALFGQGVVDHLLEAAAFLAAPQAESSSNNVNNNNKPKKASEGSAKRGASARTADDEDATEEDEDNHGEDDEENANATGELQGDSQLVAAADFSPSPSARKQARALAKASLKVKVQATVGASVSLEDRASALRLISELVPLFVFPLQQSRGELLGRCVAVLRDAAADVRAPRTRALQQTAMGLLFFVLDAMHEAHAPATGLVYRSVIWATISLGEEAVRAAMKGDGDLLEAAVSCRAHSASLLASFVDRSPGTPVGLCCEALFRQYKALDTLRGTNSNAKDLKTRLALADAGLWLSLSKHPRLLALPQDGPASPSGSPGLPPVERSALFLCDALAALCLHDPVAVRTSSLPLLAALHRCGGDFFVAAWTERFVKVALSLLVAVKAPAEPVEAKGMSPSAAIAELLKAEAGGQATMALVLQHASVADKSSSANGGDLSALLVRSASIAQLLLRLSRLEGTSSSSSPAAAASARALGDTVKELTLEMALAYADSHLSEHLTLAALLESWGAQTRDVVRAALNKKKKALSKSKQHASLNESAVLENIPSATSAAAPVGDILASATAPASPSNNNANNNGGGAVPFGEEMFPALTTLLGNELTDDEEDDSANQQTEDGADWLLKRGQVRLKAQQELKAKKEAALAAKRAEAERAQEEEEQARAASKAKTVEQQEALAEKRRLAKEAKEAALREKEQAMMTPAAAQRAHEERTAAVVRAASLDPSRSFARNAGRVESLVVLSDDAALEASLLVDPFLPYLERLFAPQLCWPALKTSLQSLPPVVDPSKIPGLSLNATQESKKSLNEESDNNATPTDEDSNPAGGNTVLPMIDLLTGMSWEADPAIRAAVQCNLQAIPSNNANNATLGSTSGSRKIRGGASSTAVTAPSQSKIAQQLKASQVAVALKFTPNKVVAEPVTLDSFLSALLNLELVPHRWSLLQVLDVHQLVVAAQAKIDPLGLHATSAAAAAQAEAEKGRTPSKRIFSILQAAYAPAPSTSAASAPSANPEGTSRAQRLLRAQLRGSDVTSADADAFFQELQTTPVPRAVMSSVLIQLACLAYHPEECVKFSSRGVYVPRPLLPAGRRVQALLQDVLEAGTQLLRSADTLKADNARAFGPHDLALWEVRGHVVRDLTQGAVRAHADKYIQAVIKDINNKITRAQLQAETTTPATAVPVEGEGDDTHEDVAAEPVLTIDSIRASCPEGFTVRSETVTAFLPSLPPSFPASAGERAALGVLDDILFSALRIRILDNHPQQKEKFFGALVSAKPKASPAGPASPSRTKAGSPSRVANPSSSAAAATGKSSLPQSVLEHLSIEALAAAPVVPRPPRQAAPAPAAAEEGADASAAAVGGGLKPAPPSESRGSASPSLKNGRRALSKAAPAASEANSPRKARAKPAAAAAAAKPSAAAAGLDTLPVEDADGVTHDPESNNTAADGDNDNVGKRDAAEEGEGEENSPQNGEESKVDESAAAADGGAVNAAPKEKKALKKEKAPTSKARLPIAPRAVPASAAADAAADAAAPAAANGEDGAEEGGAERKTGPKALNPIQEQRKREEEEAKRKREEEEAKRKRHAAKLESELKEFREKKEAEKKAEQEKKAEEERLAAERAEKARLATLKRSELLKQRAEEKRKQKREEQEKKAKEELAAAVDKDGQLPPLTSPSKKAGKGSTASLNGADSTAAAAAAAATAAGMPNKEQQQRVQAAARQRMERARKSREAAEAVDAIVNSREVEGTIAAYAKALGNVGAAFSTEQKVQQDGTLVPMLSLPDFVRLCTAFGFVLTPAEHRSLFKRFMQGGATSLTNQSLGSLALPHLALHVFALVNSSEAEAVKSNSSSSSSNTGSADAENGSSQQLLPTATALSAAVQLVCEQLLLHDPVACRARLHAFQSLGKGAPAFVPLERIANRIADLRALLPSTVPPPAAPGSTAAAPAGAAARPSSSASSSAAAGAGANHGSSVPVSQITSACAAIMQLVRLMLPAKTEGDSLAAREHRAVKAVMDSMTALQTSSSASPADSTGNSGSANKDLVDSFAVGLDELRSALLAAAQPALMRVQKQGLPLPPGALAADSLDNSSLPAGGSSDKQSQQDIAGPKKQTALPASRRGAGADKDSLAASSATALPAAGSAGKKDPLVSAAPSSPPPPPPLPPLVSIPRSPARGAASGTSLKLSSPSKSKLVPARQHQQPLQHSVESTMRDPVEVPTGASGKAVVEMSAEGQDRPKSSQSPASNDDLSIPGPTTMKQSGDPVLSTTVVDPGSQEIIHKGSV